MCHKNFLYPINCKLNLWPDVIAMFMLADVVPIVEADVIASKFIYLWQMESHSGRCYNHLIG